jgi:hypothetical protein
VLGSARTTLRYTRAANASGTTAACARIRASLAPDPAGELALGCDSAYAYLGSDGMPAHPMMNGITATNLQVPLRQHFLGSRAWRIPLAPQLAATPTYVTDGPVGVAVNGIPIFNPCKQGGCANGDTKVLGELDLCNGHAGRADDYHYHAAPVCLMATRAEAHWDTHPVGWALDGFPIFGFRDPDGTTAQRDGVCGGNTRHAAATGLAYAYHLIDRAPYVMDCLRGVPSPDLAGQAAKFSPIRQPPVTPFQVSAMTLARSADGVSSLRYTTARSYALALDAQTAVTQPAGAQTVRYRELSGQDLAVALARPANLGRTLCWRFEFQAEASGSVVQTADYCR